MITAGEALASARGLIEPAEAKLLLRHVLGCSAAELTAHPERLLTASQSTRYAAFTERRAAGEPVAYLTGTREFYGRDFHVTPAVLIPRPETELLVETVLQKVKPGETPRILDLGTGSGCIAITLALELDCAVTAVDISAEALAVARGNAERLGARVEFLESDWFAKVAGAFDFIIGNPPYVAAGDPHLAQGDLRFEPMTALASGNDGLTAIRRILTDARCHLTTGGWLFIEHGYDQAEAMSQLFAEAGFHTIEQQRDLAGIIRISGGA
ncbi:MAG: peptide chain release factor N(5)-glutamine methyltransferase [Zoogloeaceae bacterium]|jgi:release factor glutamine methyltransferase|nr:peptide chain release factor N(5)-glutamine methyltransferase [Zoogloeaceae bacterium]